MKKPIGSTIASFKNMKRHTLPHVLVFGFLYTSTLFAAPTGDESFKALLSRLEAQQQKVSVSKYSTTPLTVKQNPQKTYANKIQLLRAQGGSSDGGGNSVGQTLFDFYENQEATEPTVQRLLELQPQFKQVIERLNHLGELNEDAEFIPFGNQILKALSKKRLILDLKEIQSVGCMNESFVDSPQQQVVACQDDLEVRFYLPWIAQASAKDQAGLLLHEGLLSWARSLRGADSKNDLEKKVRILNRDIFASNSNEKVTPALRELFNLNFVSKNTATQVSAWNQKLVSEHRGFCASPNIHFLKTLEKIEKDPQLTAIREFSLPYQIFQDIFVDSFSSDMFWIKAGLLNLKIRKFETTADIHKALADGTLAPSEQRVFSSFCQESNKIIK